MSTAKPCAVKCAHHIGATSSGFERIQVEIPCLDFGIPYLKYQAENDRHSLSRGDATGHVQQRLRRRRPSIQVLCEGHVQPAVCVLFSLQLCLRKANGPARKRPEEKTSRARIPVIRSMSRGMDKQTATAHGSPTPARHIAATARVVSCNTCPCITRGAVHCPCLIVCCYPESRVWCSSNIACCALWNQLSAFVHN